MLCGDTVVIDEADEFARRFQDPPVPRKRDPFAVFRDQSAIRKALFHQSTGPWIFGRIVHDEDLAGRRGLSFIDGLETGTKVVRSGGGADHD
jgi:hypothetical protein